LLFVPGELLKRCAVLHLLHIRKEDGEIDYTLSASTAAMWQGISMV
jgi:hypothetical protein